MSTSDAKKNSYLRQKEHTQKREASDETIRRSGSSHDERKQKKVKALKEENPRKRLRSWANESKRNLEKPREREREPCEGL